MVFRGDSFTVFLEVSDLDTDGQLSKCLPVDIPVELMSPRDYIADLRFI